MELIDVINCQTATKLSTRPVKKPNSAKTFSHIFASSVVRSATFFLIFSVNKYNCVFNDFVVLAKLALIEISPSGINPCAKRKIDSVEYFSLPGINSDIFAKMMRKSIKYMTISSAIFSICSA